MKTKLIILFLFLVTGLFQPTLAQNLIFPQVSPNAKVTQRIGITDVTVNYHSPHVNGRKVWGEMVPYDQVWRAGANENTTINFTHDVNIEGKILPTGTYGLHMIPTENEWTIIFSKNYNSWGSYGYKESEDALRVKVKPVKGEFKEWLTYDFSDRNLNNAKLELQWEELRIPVNISVNSKKMVIENCRKELNKTGLKWQAPYNAALYCVTNDTNLAEAEKWLEQSIVIETNFNNLHLKSNMLEKQGKQKEAAEVMAKAMEIADETELNMYGYQLLGQKKNKEALEVFAKNIKLHPESWNVYDSYAEACELCGDKKSAIKNYKLALPKAPEEQKDRITKTIARLEAKK